MSLEVGTGKAREASELVDAIARGRNEPDFFWRFFLGRDPHPGQLEWELNAEASVNVLPTSNRWGKTTTVAARHYRRQMYKLGAEPFYLDEKGRVDTQAFFKTKYRTIHTADLWDTATLVWDDALRLRNEGARIAAFIKDAPMTKPPHIDFIWGGRWKFRTLGNDASGIDGDSYYYISVDEAGWIDDLEEKMRNVLRVRVADVRGIIDIVGTMKPGISRDFFAMAVKASAHTGVGVVFDHRDQDEEDGQIRVGGLDSTIRRYLAEFGIDLDEFAEAASGA